jgi:hypothetical protein
MAGARRYKRLGMNGQWQLWGAAQVIGSVSFGQQVPPF